jgi:hypothetical protein
VEVPLVNSEKSDIITSDRLNTPISSFNNNKSGAFSQSKSGRDGLFTNNNNNGGGGGNNSFSNQSTTFGASVKGGPKLGGNSSGRNKNNSSSAAASLKSSIKIAESKYHSSPQNSLSPSQRRADEAAKQLLTTDAGMDSIFQNNEDAKKIFEEETSKMTAKDQEDLKKSIADRILGPEGSPTKSFGTGGLSTLLLGGSVKRDELSENHQADASQLLLESLRAPGEPPADFVQNPLLSDRILTEAFDKVLQVAKEAEERKAEEEEKRKGLGLSVMDRDLGHHRSPSHHHHHHSPFAESMFRKDGKSLKNERYVPKSRPPPETEEDLRAAYQDRVRASILNAPLEDEDGDDDETKGKEKLEEQQQQRPTTADEIRDLVRSHAELTFSLRNELAQLARMMNSSSNEKEKAALRRAVISTAWKYQHGREINLRRLILLLERKTHHRKWLPFIVNENVYADFPGYDDSVVIPHSGRVHGGWRLYQR